MLGMKASQRQQMQLMLRLLTPWQQHPQTQAQHLRQQHQHPQLEMPPNSNLHNNSSSSSKPLLVPALTCPQCSQSFKSGEHSIAWLGVARASLLPGKLTAVGCCGVCVSTALSSTLHTHSNTQTTHNTHLTLHTTQNRGDYESFGEPVWPTKFIPMKTPLSHDILDNWQLPQAPKHRLTVGTLLAAERAAGRRVGLLLDLSNHGERAGCVGWAVCVG